MIEPYDPKAALAWLMAGGEEYETAVCLIGGREDRHQLMALAPHAAGHTGVRTVTVGTRRICIVGCNDGPEALLGWRPSRIWATSGFELLVARGDHVARELWREAWFRLGLRAPEPSCAIGEGAG